MTEQHHTTVIESKSKIFDFKLRETWQYRDLVMLFVKKNFIVFYKQTILGPAWAIIQPLLLTVVFTLIFGNVANLGPAGVPSFAFYFSGTIIWTYFSSCLTDIADTFGSNKAVLGKVYFPRIVMPLSTVISKLITFGIQFVFLIAFMLYYIISGQNIHPNIYILMTPLLILQFGMLSLGFGIIISALTTKYRDLVLLFNFIVQVWMYASPIAYDMFGMKYFMQGSPYYPLYMSNPVTPVVNVFRYAFLGIGKIDWLFYSIGWVTTMIILFVGMLMFTRVEKTFTDTI